MEVKAAYVEHFEEGLVEYDSLLMLYNSINEGMDRSDEGLLDWNFLHGLVSQGFFVRLGIRW